MKFIAIVTAVVIGASPAFAQEGEDQMTPAQAMELLKEAHRLMDLAERLLHEESVEKAEKKEKDAVERLAEVIKMARSAASKDPQKQQQQKQDPAKSKSREAGETAKHIYNPNRTDPPSKFKSRGDSGSWGNLPPAVRDAIRATTREEVPPEFQELWKRYYESLENSGK